MKPIVTLTLNPAIDGFCEAEIIRPILKIRTTNERYSPGGGGINVARVVHELGGKALALYLAGGITGTVLDSLVDEEEIPRRTIRIADQTRVAQVVIEHSTKLEYRFVPEGPRISEAEWRAALDALRGIDCDYLVASGSLPRGVPADFYGRVADIAKARGAKFVLDTSGDALAAALDHGGIHLVKPSLGEFEALVGRSLSEEPDQDAEALRFARSGKVDMIAVTLGRDGAFLATAERVSRLKAPEVEAKSAVGAGDSFVAAMTLALAEGHPPEVAFRRGVAAGTAAVLRRGTALCLKEDVDRLMAQIAEAA